MPRNSAGTFTLVPGNPVQSGDVVSSTWANSTLDDVADALTDSLDREGRGGMLAPFRFADGTNLLPGASWVNENTTGFYRFDGGDLRVSVLTQDVMRWQNSGAQVWNSTDSQWENILSGNSVPAFVNAGTAESQTLRWDNTGEQWLATDTLSVSTTTVTVNGTLLSPGAGTNSFRAGVSTGLTSQGAQAVAIGYIAGNSAQGDNAVAIGREAGRTDQDINAVAVGRDAGGSDQGAHSVAVGNGAGKTTQAAQSVAMGYQAGNATQSTLAVAVGNNAGQTTQGASSVAVGPSAGQTTQGTNAVAVGKSAGLTWQSNNSVAMGNLAGNDTQGASSVAVGTQAAETTQGSNAVAVGNSAGKTAQSNNSVAVGRNSGEVTQGANSVAVGNAAGKTDQGDLSVAIGTNAGITNQGANGIIINATGAALDDTSDGHIHIASDDGSLDFTTAGGWSMSDDLEVTGTVDSDHGVSVGATEIGTPTQAAVSSITTVTQAEYDAIVTPDANTLYVIV